MKRIYLDYNATTPLKPAIYEGMLPYFKDTFGNPSSIHWAGRKAKEALLRAREQISRLFHIEPDDIVFTSGGTEANNLALKGVFEKFRSKGRHIITTQVEHASILETCKYLEQQGAEVTYLPVSERGQIDLEALKKGIRSDTILITIQAANSETGVMTPIAKIGAIAKEAGVLFHTDAIQRAGKIALYLDEIPVDLISISSHKMNGPKGIGALIVRHKLKLEPLLHGGGQERKRRAGTENVAGIVGFGLACHSALNEGAEDTERCRDLRDRLEEGILDNIPHCHINGKGARRVPNTLNVSFEGIEGEGLLLNLDLEGVFASSGSACSSGALRPSHVLLSMGCSEQMALNSIRFSLGYQTTKSDVDRVIELLPPIVSDLRKLALS